MRLLVAGLEIAGFSVGLRVPARKDWTRDGPILDALRKAQVIVINGEGTLHDGAPQGAKLLEVVEAAQGVPVALVNALWERNPPEWTARLAGMALVAARDSRSAAAMTSAIGRPVRWLPDLSLSAPAELAAHPRDGLIVGDSVRADSRRLLARAAQDLGATYLPTKTLSGTLWQVGVLRTLLWRGYNGVWRGSVPRFEMAANEAEYLVHIASAEGHVTGRFHAVCLSMLTETPFFALASRTSKIETLLADAGLGHDRLVSADDLAALTAATAVRPFSGAETAALRDFRAMAVTEAARLFADIRGLAG
jgi:polysaccharide pyruvyl transferase WcaK-like protein